MSVVGLRPLVNEVVDRVGKLASEPDATNRGLIVIIEAPTAYGKTVSAPLLFGELNEAEAASSMIHVLPLRAIVRDFYLCKLVYSLVSEEKELVEFCGSRTLIHDKIREVFEKTGLGVDDLGYQMGERIYGRKEPLYETRYTVTTLDSFLYNLYRVPVTELFSHKKHYAIPRMRIFVSSVFFDEAHLVFEEHDDVKLYVASREALRVLKYMRVPTIIASATLTKRVLGDIKEVIDSEVLVHIKLCSRSEREGDAICVFDEEFLNETTSIEWRISKVREDEVVDRVREFVEQGKRVLVACDTVDDAIRRYRGLASIDSMRDKIALLHGRLTHEDRRRAFEKMKKAGKGFALVATSVVEAGVDISFDVLITDVSRVTSFIQRCGRVCRRVDECRDGRAEVYLVESTACLKDPICNGVIEFVERHQSFVPRIPFDFKNYKGYGDLLELHDMYLSASLGKSPKSRKELHQPSFLQMLSTALFVSSHSINIVLRESDYALVRTGIVEVFVGSEESKRLSEDKRLHLSVDQVNKILNRAPRCIKYFVLLDENGEVLDKAPIEHITETSSGDKRRLVLRKLYEELVKLKRRERRVDVEHYGLLLAEDCYEQGVGLRT